MAMPVEFREFTPKDSRNDLARRLEQAPHQHAEAILATYELLERMHETGLIDMANGLLSARDTVVERATDVVSSRRAVTALRLATGSWAICWTLSIRTRRCRGPITPEEPAAYSLDGDQTRGG